MVHVRHALLVLAVMSLAPAARAQTPAPAKPDAPQGQPGPAPAAAAAPQAPAPAGTPPAQESYTYRADGRRDPFLNLVGSGTEGKIMSRRGEGPTGLTVAEISVRGIMQSRGALVARI